MLEAHHYSAAAKKKGTYKLPAAYDGTVNEAVLYHAVRAFLGNQRQGTSSTKTRSEVSGGTAKPWRQKGTGRARQGTTRAGHWRGGGVIFGPKPRTYKVKLPRRVKRLARQSALNARATDGAVTIIEQLSFEKPSTKQLLATLGKLGVADQKVLVLTADHRPEVHLSARNLQRVYVMRYAEATAYEILWADALVIEEAAVAGEGAGGDDEASSKKPVIKRAAAKKSAPTKKGATTKKRASKKRVTKKKSSGDV
jgi:large subunit ribosomal protein L4